MLSEEQEQKLLESFVEVDIKNQKNFLIIAETLSRIGLLSTNTEGRKRLYQSCHILHKRGKYYVTHFKEMLELDGKYTDFNDEDLGRRNTISNCLESWGLLNIIDKTKTKIPTVPMSKVTVIPFKEKANYDFVTKYSIGKGK